MAVMEDFYKSVLEQDEAAVVLCDLNHIIVYMNPAAARRYAKSGGYDLVGKSLMGCHNAKSNEMIEKVVAWFKKSSGNSRFFKCRDESVPFVYAININCKSFKKCLK